MAWGFSKKLKDAVDDESAYKYEDEPAQTTSVPQTMPPVQEEEAEPLAVISTPGRREVENSVISKTCVVRGNIEIDQEDLVVLGCVEGNVTGKGDITLSGTIIGDVVCRNFTLVCGELQGNLSCEGNAAIYADGYLHGNIQRAENMELSGTVEGDVYVHGLTSLLGSSHLNGNVATTRLKIEDGALLNGQVKVLTEVVEDAAVEAVPAAPSVPALDTSAQEDLEEEQAEEPAPAKKAASGGSKK